MAEAARQTPGPKPTPAEPISLRRFELPDINEHGGWLMDRLLQVHPSASQQQILSWLHSVLYNNEYLFLYQKNAVALAEVTRGYLLSPSPIVQERFLFLREPQNMLAAEAARAFYADFARWAKSLGADMIIFSEHSDIDPEKSKDTFGGRLFTKSYTFAKTSK